MKLKSIKSVINVKLETLKDLSIAVIESIKVNNYESFKKTTAGYVDAILLNKRVENWSLKNSSSKEKNIEGSFRERREKLSSQITKELAKGKVAFLKLVRAKNINWSKVKITKLKCIKPSIGAGISYVERLSIVLIEKNKRFSLSIKTGIISTNRGWITATSQWRLKKLN